MAAIKAALKIYASLKNNKLFIVYAQYTLPLVRIPGFMNVVHNLQIILINNESGLLTKIHLQIVCSWHS